MIDGLKPYPKYKDSGVPWLGEVPEHWEVRRLKYLFREVDERSAAGEEELLSVSHLTGVTPRREKNVTMFLAESNAGHKVCKPDDVVVNTMWAWMAALGVSRHNGLVSPSYGVYRPIRGDVLSPMFVDRLLRTETFRSEYLRRSTGVNSSRLRLYPEQFLRMAMSYPSAAEQTAIIRFLQYLDARINRYIRAKKMLIALLNEQKQAIIQRAVSQGLDSTVRLKQSGVQWLGEVPDHWCVVPFKRIAWFRSGAGFPITQQGNTDAEVPFVKVSDMNRRGNEKFMSTTSSSVSREVAAELGAYIFPASTVIFPKVGGALLTNKRRILSKPSCIDNNLMGCVVTEANPEYAFIVLQSLELGRLAKPGPVPALGEGDVREIKVAVPLLGEQAALCDYFSAATADIDRVLRITQEQMLRLNEFRVEVMTRILTGKLDVREAAARLPDETTNDELPEIDDTSEEIEDADMEMTVDDAEE